MLLEFGSLDAVEFWDLGMGGSPDLGRQPCSTRDCGIWDLGFRLPADAQGEYRDHRIGIWLKTVC